MMIYQVSLFGKVGVHGYNMSKNTRPMSHSIPDFLNGCTLLRTGRSTTLVQTAHSVLKLANNPNNKKAQLR